MVSNRNITNLHLNVNHGYTTAQGVVKGMDGSFFLYTWNFVWKYGDVL